jgi:DNA end-binding protein Ku
LPERDRSEPAPVRAFWSGTITFGLVNIPVDLFAAVRSRRTAMKMVDRKGRPLGRQYYCPKDRRKLSAGDIVRGYETDGGEMVVVTDEELEAIAPDMSRDIDLRRFVPREQIPPAYYQRPYFLAPSGRSTKAYHLLAETMERTGKVGIGTFVMRGHEYLVAILSDGGLLRAETLRFAEELRSPADVGLPKRRKPPPRRVNELARAIAGLQRDALDMHELGDRYAEAIQEKARAKEKKKHDVVKTAASAEEEDAEAAGAEVIDLVKLLRERVASRARVSTAASTTPPARRSADDGLRGL